MFLKEREQSGKKAANECQGLRRISLMKNNIPGIEKGIRHAGRLLLCHTHHLTSIFMSPF